MFNDQRPVRQQFSPPPGRERTHWHRREGLGIFDMPRPEPRRPRQPRNRGRGREIPIAWNNPRQDHEILFDRADGSPQRRARHNWGMPRRRSDNENSDETWNQSWDSGDPKRVFIDVPLQMLRKKFDPGCRLKEPEPIVFSTKLVECSDPVPERMTPQRSPVIPKKELKLGLLKLKKCLDQVQPELVNMASSRCQLESDAHPTFQDSFAVFSHPDGFKKIVVKSQDGLLSTLVKKEKLDERVLYVTNESLSQVKARFSKARMLNKQVVPEIPKMEGIKSENLKSSKADAQVRIRELTATERALCPAENNDRQNVYELSTRMFMFPPKLIDFEAKIMPLDLDEADQGGQKYTVKVMWATQPHTYKARIKIEGDHMDAMKAKTILNSCDVVNKCHHVNTKGGHYFSSDSWLRKGSELDIWFRNRIGGDRRDEDLQMTSDELEHVVKMLLEVNNITMTQINFSRSKEEPISQKDAVYKINKRLAQCAIHAGVWEHQERNTETEWRNFFERNTQKLSWKITDYQILPNDDRDLSATIEFSNVPCGTAICDYILRNSNNNVFFKFNHVQVARTRFSCRYHSTFFVPPEIRVLLNADIKKLDGDVRKTTDGDHSSWARIRDLPNSMMSVEGWSREYVDDVVGQLKKKLKPEAFDCSVGSRSQLLYGCGLQLVNQQQDRFVGRVFISMDRLNEKITLIGEQAAIAGIKQCFLDFVDRPHNFAVQTAIKIDPPMYLPIMKSVLDYNGETALGELLGGCMVRFQKPNQLLFEGSVHQYNQLRLLLDKTQYEVLNKVTEKTISKRAKELFISTSECPVCTAPYSFDKYRIACGHAYCLQCLTLLIKHSLGSGEIPIRCVQPRCQKLVGIRDIMSLLFDEKSIQIRNFFPERLEPLFKAANKAAAKADDMIPCIKAGCEGFLERAEKEYIRTIYCPICRTARCSTCTNPPHVGRSCEQEVEFRSNDELAIEHYIKSRRDNVKKCPTKNCEALIQKEEGCNHMHCTFCKIHFCWSCLFSAESQQEVYAHMQNNHGGTGGEWAHLDLPPGFGFAAPGFGGQGFGFRGFRGQSPPPGLRRPFPNQRGFLGNIEDSDSD